MEETVFTTAALLDLLSQIDELSEYEITINEVGGAVTLSIGDSTYKIAKPTEQVKIPEKALAEVSAINDGAYESIKWQKASRTSSYTLLKQDGITPLELDAGKTYIAIAPIGAKTEFE